MKWSPLVLIARIVADVDEAVSFTSHQRISSWATKRTKSPTSYPSRNNLKRSSNHNSILDEPESEDVASLRDLGKECDRRTKLTPYETQDANNVFKGDGSKGYNVIKAGDLLVESLNVDATENDAILMDVVNALVSHSCLVVDITDGGTKFGDALTLSKMWDTSEKFFETLRTNSEIQETLPGMKAVDDAVSPHAVTGFASYGGGSMQFLETRIVRDAEDRIIVPKESISIIGEDGATNMIDAFDVMCEVGKDVVKVAVAAASIEYEAFVGESSDIPIVAGDTEITGIINVDEEGNFVEANRMSFEAAALMTKEMIDDGKLLAGNIEQGIVNMSPHRICRYKAMADTNKPGLSNGKETFGAHTDTSFMTLVPVAATSGLEIFDEGANKWLRPELLARQAWEDDRQRKGLDSELLIDSVTIFDGDQQHEVDLPWHCRYVVAMPGELLQIITRNKVAAAVHRVVSANVGEPRISAPALLRARSGVRMNLSKFLGNSDTFSSILKECDGMKLEDIHDALQPSSYRRD